MSHSIDFFRDEVRNGFYVPTAVKQAWASCLDVLKEVDRICTKYGIKYFADWGSFLGAVRHGGFVPWDDDLDICMLRDDYIKFRKVCDKELPKHFMIHDYERKEDHWLFLSRVVNNKNICFDEDYLTKHYNFPWLATVDIFIKDYLYMDEELERERDKEILYLISLADGIREGTFDRRTILYNLQKIKEKYHTSLPDIGNARDLCVALYRLAEKEMAKVKPEETDIVGQIFPWILKGGKGQPKAYYDKVIRLPFEDTTIPVPAGYNTVLASRYRNYNEIHKVWDGHTYPFFEGQKADLEIINGEPLPDRVFDRKMLDRPEVDRSNSLKVIAEECIQELQRLYSMICGYLKNDELSAEDIADIEENLTTSQQLSIDLGTLIEQVKGEDRACTKMVVGILESYCEAIYQCFQSVSGTSVCGDGDNRGDTVGNSTEYSQIDKDGQENIRFHISLGTLGENLDQVIKKIKEYIFNRKEILILPIGPREWKGFEKTYQYYAGHENDVFERNDNEYYVFETMGGGERNITGVGKYDIYVVPLPVLTKDPLGRVAVSDGLIREGLKIDRYPTSITYANWQSYDISQHCPDIVYIQNPYDADNPYLTVPPQYYASNIRRFTDKLVYIPFKDTCEFSEKNDPDLYNLKHYAAASGVICSDVIVVQSENIKHHYVNALTNYMGEDTRNVWEQKIVIRRESYFNQSFVADKHAIVSKLPAMVNLPNDEKTTGVHCSNPIENIKQKHILYCIGANELTEHKEEMMKALSERLEIFRQNSDKIVITTFLYPSDRKQWRKVEPELSDKLFNMIDNILNSDTMYSEILPMDADTMAEEYDAYYGSSSPLVPAFLIRKKPVMLADYFTTKYKL